MSKRIMVVEDTSDLLTQIVDILDMEGYQVLSAANGRLALTLLTENKVDLIITDLLMPELDGFEFITEIRNNRLSKNIPIIVFSAMPAQQNSQKVLQLGANLYIRKPSTADHLVGAVDKLIKNEEPH